MATRAETQSKNLGQAVRDADHARNRGVRVRAFLVGLLRTVTSGFRGRWHALGFKDYLCWSALIAAVITAQCIAWAVDRAPPIEIVSGSITPNPAAPGDTIDVQLVVREYNACSGTVFRRIIDSAGIVHAYDETPATYRWVIPRSADNKPVVFSRTLVLPKTLAQGPAKYSPIVRWWCNPIQWLFPVQITQTPIDFEIGSPHLATDTPLPRARPSSEIVRN